MTNCVTGYGLEFSEQYLYEIEGLSEANRLVYFMRSLLYMLKCYLVLKIPILNPNHTQIIGEHLYITFILIVIIAQSLQNND